MDTAKLEDLRVALGELLLEDDWMRENYLEPFDALEAVPDSERVEKRNALYDGLQIEMHRTHFDHMLKLIAQMRKCLTDDDGGGK